MSIISYKARDLLYNGKKRKEKKFVVRVLSEIMEFEPHSTEDGSAMRLLSPMVNLGWEPFQSQLKVPDLWLTQKQALP